MKILVDILNPSHVHFFHHFIRECERAGHSVLITARKKRMVTELLDSYGHPYRMVSTQGRRRLDLVWNLLLRNRSLSEIAQKFRPDALLGILGISIAAIGKRLGIPSYVFCDVENASVSNWLTFPRATEVITPRSFLKKVRGNHVTYPGYQELAYLHPRRFTPDLDVLRALGVARHERFTLVRFASWRSSHEFLPRGFTQDGKRRLVKSLLRRSRVLISSDKPLPSDLEALRLPLPASLIHHVLAAADLLVGDGATMASEAAVLGTPAVFYSSAGHGSTTDEECRYGLVRTARREDHAILAAEEILDTPNLEVSRRVWARRREQLLAEQTDVTGWMLSHLGIQVRQDLPQSAPSVSVPIPVAV